MKAIKKVILVCVCNVCNVENIFAPALFSIMIKPELNQS